MAAFHCMASGARCNGVDGPWYRTTSMIVKWTRRRLETWSLAQRCNQMKPHTDQAMPDSIQGVRWAYRGCLQLTPSSVPWRDPFSLLGIPDLSVYRTTIIYATWLRHGNQWSWYTRGTTHIARVNRAWVHSTTRQSLPLNAMVIKLWKYGWDTFVFYVRSCLFCPILISKCRVKYYVNELRNFCASWLLMFNS